MNARPGQNLREKLHHLNAAPINDIAERWISRYDQPRIDALSDLKKTLENTTMNTVLHDGFEPGSLAARLVRGGWPQVISSLKTLLETDHALVIA